MPAREPGRRPAYDLGPETAPHELEAADAGFATERDLPLVRVPNVSPLESASDLAFGDPAELDRGMHEVEEYRAACEATGQLEKWQDHYVHGHTEAQGFTQPYERNEDFLWTLQSGCSASQALKDFIAGPTIADYRAIGVAQALEELRDDLGDLKFDQLFGSMDSDEDAAVRTEHRLVISSDMYTTPFVDHMKQIAADHDARPTVLDLVPPPIREPGEGRQARHDTLTDEEEPIIAEDLGRRPDRDLM
jgi:hypothetical protein